MFQQTNEGINFKVKVIPKARRHEIVEWENEELKIRLAAVPVKGEANTELLRYLASILQIGKSQIWLLNGETSRHKRICVAHLSQEEIEKKLGSYFVKKQAIKNKI